jgi:hypothetical protein
LRRRGIRLPWELIGLTIGCLLLVAYALVPGWDALAHLLFLDRTTAIRIRIGLGIGAFAMVPFAIASIEKAGGSRAVQVTGIVTAAAFLLSQIGIAGALTLREGLSGLADQAPFWWVYALASAASIALIAWRRTLLAVLLVAIMGVAGAVGVNPVYVGVLDLRSTPAGQGVVSVDPERDDNWLAVGSGLPTSLLIEQGMQSFSGTQGAPSATMWSQVDPRDAYSYEWNRLGTVRWEFGTGEPVVDNPAPDVIRATFDPCSEFAQQRVRFVIADVDTPDSACLVPVQTYDLPSSTIRIFEIEPSS